MIQFARPCKACGKSFMPMLSDNPDRDICYSCAPLPPLIIKKKNSGVIWTVVIIAVLGLVALLILR